ncbi:Serine/threonine protein kinase [Labilithrix luteola]|uniref:Serine/threonine protein kinase n=1 Tax=Labilithrix luteola TaxID=1391654 RepID=A0A0K1PXY9_9BACT|nr:serine/threonine-protein kinase [Labilithrix luteola]AKU98395.1 Serine/threonine protein kinase [Labilithrix luteola]
MEDRSARLKMDLLKKEKPEESVRSGVIDSGIVQAKDGQQLVGGITPGAILDGKYLVGELIGSGAFGLVYEATNLELDEKVALKVMRPEVAVDNKMVARFAREAKAAAAIRSEYVATVYDVGTGRDGLPYIVMEYLAGKHLGAIVEESGPMQPRAAVEYALQLCEALAVAHSKRIVHRDIKPENLFLAERAGGMPIIKVLDFGISKAALTGSIFGNELPIVQTVNLMGTPLYMSPEQVRCTDVVDMRSDIWSFGMVLYEILTGTTAFEGASIPQICAAILETQPKPIEVYRHDLPSGLVEVVSRCLEKDVNRRYQNVAELALALMPFGPKRSRLNVERAVAVLQGAGQVDPALKVDSVPPPPSSDLYPPVSIPRPAPLGLSVRLSEGSDTLPANVVAAPSVNDPSITANIRKDGRRSRASIVVAIAVVLVGVTGAAAVFLHRSPAPAPAPARAEATTASAAPAGTVATEPTTATATATATPEPGTPEPTATGTGTTATAKNAPAPQVRAVAGHPRASTPAAKTAAAVATPTAAPAAPPAPQSAAPAPAPAAPTETSKGRTFRREL